MTEYVVDFGDEKSSAFVRLAMAQAEANGARLCEEIVRCKSCMHSHEDRRCTSTGWVDVLVCESKQWNTSSLMPNHTVKDDGFCAWRERREDA